MTAKKSTAKKKQSREGIMTLFMEQCLMQEHPPKSVFKFCKENNLTEADFYHYFGSFESLQKEIWNHFFDHSKSLLQKSAEYEAASTRDKMLMFYFTFFEVLTANRSYAIFILQDARDAMKHMAQLSGLRARIKEFAGQLIEATNETKQLKVLKQPVSVFSEGAWLQTLFILKYWMSDNSPGFEKTDMVIEKSVRAIFDIFETTPLESVIDFGKFLWKEKMN